VLITHGKIRSRRARALAGGAAAAPAAFCGAMRAYWPSALESRPPIPRVVKVKNENVGETQL
jgi:hypothetical protein